MSIASILSISPKKPICRRSKIYVRLGEMYQSYFWPAPSDRPAEFVVDENAHVVRGEPEYTMLELVKALESKSIINGIKSVSLKKQKKPQSP